MKVWVDGQCFQSSSRVRGIGRYALEFLRAISLLDRKIDLVVSLNATQTDTALQASHMLKEAIPNAELSIWHGLETSGETQNGNSDLRQLSAYVLENHIVSHNPDVAISLSPFEGLTEPYSGFLPSSHFPVPTAGIFYDAIPNRLSSIYLENLGMRKAYKRRLSSYEHFDKLFCISDYSTREAEHFISNCDAINIGAGLQDKLLDLQPRKNDAALSNDRYKLLYIGGLDYRKNLKRTIKAIALLPANLRNSLDLVIGGGNSEADENQLRLEWQKCGLKAGQLFFTGYLSDDKLVELYQNVDALIQPSLLEGFGLTALEAQACGTPVLSSNTSALPEIVNDDRIMFDPNSEVAIKDRLIWALQNKRIHQEIALTNQTRAREYSWSRVAEKTMKGLLELTAQPQDTGNDFKSFKNTIASKTLKLNVDRTFAAASFAASENTPADKGRFFIDVTSTAKFDHKSGIQRVVRRICDNAASHFGKINQDAPILIGADTQHGFFPTHITDNSEHWKVSSDEIIKFGSKDRILMLDSSWEETSVHTPTLQLASISGTKIYTVLYDLVPILYPAFCHRSMPIVFGHWLQNCLTYSDGIICISKSVADDLIQLLRAIDYPRPTNIGYWHLGADFSPIDASSNDLPAPKTGRVSFLCVGTIEPRKGYSTIMDAFDEALTSNDNIELTIVGRAGWNTDELIERIQSHSEFGDRLIWEAHADDVRLLQLYKNSDALITASFNEGFGLPIIEAEHFGLPIIASDIPVFREVVSNSDRVLFFERGNANKLAEIMGAFEVRMSSTSTDPTHDKSWKNSAAELFNTINEDQWYHRFVPDKSATVFRSGFYANLTHVDEIEWGDSRGCEISIVDGPILNREASTLDIYLRIKNLTNETLCGESCSGSTGKHVSLAAMPLGPDDEFIGHAAFRSPIPFVLPPKAELFQTISVPISSLAEGLSGVVIDLIQESCKSFGGAITVSLLDWLSDSLSDSDLFTHK